MDAEQLFLQKYGNRIIASESWVIRFAEEYAAIFCEEQRGSDRHFTTIELECQEADYYS